MGSSKINSDLAFEILSRMDIKDLDLCKTVCKEWNDISFESEFTPTHCERTGTISGFFVQNPKSRVSQFVAGKKSNQDISFAFLPIDLRLKSNIVASTKQGILCFKSYEHKKECFFVCKPSTKQWVILPNPKMRYHTENVGIAVVGSDPLHYMIIRVSRPKHREYINGLKNYYYEIFDSKAWTWMRLNDIWVPDNAFIDHQHCVVIGGSIYALLTNNYVLEFNTYTKNHTTFPLPQSLTLNYPRLVEYKGKLGFICSKGDDYFYTSSILENRKKRIWREIKTLRLEKLRDKQDLGSCIGFWNADIAVMINFCEINFYNFRNDTFQNIKMRGAQHVFHDNIFMFRSDTKPTQLFCKG